MGTDTLRRALDWLVAPPGGRASLAPDVFLPYWLRVVQTGVQATILAVAAIALFWVLPGHAVTNTPLFLTFLLLGAVGAGVAFVLPWRRLLKATGGVWGLYVWSVADILLITLLMAVTGGATSEMYLLYALTTVFFAISYPLGGQVLLLLFTYACYLTLTALQGWDITPALLVFRMAVLGVLTLMTSFAARELMTQMIASANSSRDSERRASLLATVAAAAREFSLLGPDVVLRKVVDSLVHLGFEAGALCMLEQGGETYTPVHPIGLPPSYAEGRHATSIGMVGLVVREQGTVAIDDYQARETSVPSLRQAGLRSAIAVPIWGEGELVAVLVGATAENRRVAAEEIEAFELLAAQASRALENARSYEEKELAVERLEELDRLKSEFLTSVSHELRTPLTSVEGLGLTLERRWRDLSDTDRDDLLSRLNANARTLEEIVTKLLDFSRLETGSMKPRLERFELGNLVRGVVTRLHRSLVTHEVTVAVDGELWGLGDRVLLDRVLDNLVANAARYTPAGSRISIAGFRDADDVAVEVADNGPGISPQDLRHLGERFYRGGEINRRAVRGTGLGLALVREILELHGSTLEVASTLGEGSTFGFRLRAAEAAPQMDRADSDSL